MAGTAMTRRDFLAWAARAAAGGAAAAAWSACREKPSVKTVKFLNSAGYTGRQTLPRFESETKVLINYDFYTTEREMLSKISAQPKGYDLVVSPDNLIEELKRQRLIAPVPQSRLKCRDRIVPEFRDPEYDRGLAYSVPYLWGTTGIGYNTKRFPKPPTSWKALSDERYKGRISMLDNRHEALQWALLVLDLPKGTQDLGHFNQALESLLRQRPLLAGYNADSYADDLADGKLWLAQSWSGDILKLKAVGAPVDFVIPAEGAFLWVDSLHLLRGAERSDEVLRFVEYLLKPDVAAEISETTRYATPVEGARALLDPVLGNDQRVYPSGAARARLHRAPRLGAPAENAWGGAWARLKQD